MPEGSVDLRSRAWSPAFAWAVGWLLASQSPKTRIAIEAPEVPSFDRPAFGRIGSRLCRPEADAPEALFAFCREHGVEFDRCGELFLAPKEDTARLLDLFQSGTRRGLNLLNLPPEGLRSRYPDVFFPEGVRGLLDLNAGVLDLQGLRASLQSRAEELGVCLLTQRTRGAWRIEASGGMVAKRSVRASATPIPVLVSGLPEPGLAELAPCMGQGLGHNENHVRAGWRRLSRARHAIARLRASGLRLQSLLPPAWRDNLQSELAVRSGAPLNAQGKAMPMSVERRGRRSLRLSHTVVEPIDLFPVAAFAVERILEQVAG